MSDNFLRIASVQVETLLVRSDPREVDETRQPLRVTFKVEKKGTADPNTCQVSIYNLNEESRAQLRKLDRARLILSAGFPATFALLFSGDLRRPNGIQDVREGPDDVTLLECGDGERAYQEARFTGSFAKGTKAVDVARSMAKSLGVGLGNLEEAMAGGNYRLGLSEYAFGYAAHGASANELFRVLRGLGFEASIQDGQLQVLRPGQVARGKQLLLSTFNGNVIGSPRYKSPDKKGGAPTLKLRAHLDANLRPGVGVQVESRDVNGSFRVKAVSHSGDTHGGGGSWVSDCDLVGV